MRNEEIKSTPVPLVYDHERRIPLGELWQEITGRAEGYRPLPPARLEIARKAP